MKISLLIAIPVALSAQDLSQLELRGVTAETANHQGAQATHLIEKAGNTGDAIAILRDSSFHNGTIEIDVSGEPAKGAFEGARGFVGVAFRMTDAAHYECIYIRPTNARADDQLRRNHTTQYISVPDWPWERLRQETPGVYESYADMEPGKWVHLRIVVTGKDASLYVNGATQPCLLIHALKLGDATGRIALWSGPGTEGYFKNLKVL